MEIIVEYVNVQITKRDLFIFEFIDANGWVRFDILLRYLDKNHEHIDPQKYPNPMTNDSLRVRLNLLCRAGYLRRTRFNESNYYATTPISAKDYGIIDKMNFNQANHNDFLVTFAYYFSDVKFNDFATQRMVRARFGVGVKTGPIPDLIYLAEDHEDAAYFEYEYSDKSELAIKLKIENLIWDEKRRYKNCPVFIICATQNIHNKYLKVLMNFFDYNVEKKTATTYERKNITTTKTNELAIVLRLISDKEFIEKVRRDLKEIRRIYNVEESIRELVLQEEQKKKKEDALKKKADELKKLEEREL
jgi:hypothetical protein